MVCGFFVSANDTSQSKGRLLRWLYGSKGLPYGTDPGEYDGDAVAKTLERMSSIFGPGKYFQLDSKGWENIPTSPALLVSNHSGGTTIPDVWGFMAGWYKRFGPERPLHPLAHEIILATRLTGEYFGRRGVLKAHPRVAEEALVRFQRDVMVMPGGDQDAWRPFSERYSVRFGGRTGYARLALRTGSPIVPIANAGAHDTLFVLTDGRGLARKLGLQNVARAEIFPIHFSLPYGLAIGPWPHLPVPTTLRYRIGPVIELPDRPAAGAPIPDALVQELDARVQRAIQGLLDGLRDEEMERKGLRPGRTWRVASAAADAARQSAGTAKTREGAPAAVTTPPPPARNAPAAAAASL